MEHPVKECISMLGVSQVSFAVLHDLSFQRLKACLYGHTPAIPPRIVNALVQHGYDEQEAQKQYQQWRKWKAEQELLTVARKGGGEIMNRLPLDIVVTLMRREQVLNQYEIDQLAALFGKHVKDSVSTEDVEYALACYLAKSKHNDVVYRNSV
ncbi:hypothetical protein, partial [Rhodococcus rhodochrous]|uniref:hypothetical protein n=1 Tax=Rhodococcus rhodochrous TaxID=1829 RepID=UPI001E43DFB4